MIRPLKSKIYPDDHARRPFIKPPFYKMTALEVRIELRAWYRTWLKIGNVVDDRQWATACPVRAVTGRDGTLPYKGTVRTPTVNLCAGTLILSPIPSIRALEMYVRNVSQLVSVQFPQRIPVRIIVGVRRVPAVSLLLTPTSLFPPRSSDHLRFER
jgi:hypothetical protein